MTAATLSTTWLETAKRAVNADPAFRKRGSIDTRMALKVDKSAYLVTFSGFTCHDVKALDGRDLRDADFTIEMSAAAWDRFLAGRRDGNGRTLAELDTTDGIVHAVNPRKKFDFQRFHTSLQAFFDAGASANRGASANSGVRAELGTRATSAPVA